MKLTCYEYRIPFTRPFETAGRRYSDRTGLWFELTRDGITARGEAAPLPGFSRETPEDVKTFISGHRAELQELAGGPLAPEDLERFFGKAACPPSLEYALLTLAYDYQSQKESIPLQRLLFENPLERIPVNEVIPLSTPAETLARVRNAVEEGYRCIKFKIGKHFDDEYGLLVSVRKKFPDVKIRLDANGSWTPREAAGRLKALSGLRPEYCEEPISNPTVKQLIELGAASPVPVALDESLAGIQDLHSLAESGFVFILKPMVIGSFSKLFATIRVAETHNNKAVITTSLETGIARMMTAILASGPGTSNTEHGLATGKYLKMDVWHDGTYINNGYFHLPDAPGLGKKRRSDLQDLASGTFELIT